jgi:glycosyltransferase involved in cell wall biosynthesis
LNLVLSYGDLGRPGGYRTRVLGELHTLDRQRDLDPFLLLFDRNPIEFQKTFRSNVPYQVLHRSDVLQFPGALGRLARQKPIRLVHAHNLYSAALAISIRWRHRYKVVLDYHGRIPEEYVFLGKGGQASRKLLECLERWCVLHSDHIVAVSQKLAEYLIDRYKVPPHKLSVIPCCADELVFRWDNTRRTAERKRMNLSDKFICTHLGSFFEWYEPDMITTLFQQIRTRTDSHLLVITGDSERAHAFLSARLPADTFTVREAAHDEVPGLLNASDLGFLLLRTAPNIKTSSPAKFAEYLNSGLPVLITPEVGDFSDMVKNQGVGAVIDRGASNFDVSLVDRTKQDRAQLAAQCTAAGHRLTWQVFSSTWSHIALS